MKKIILFLAAIMPLAVMAEDLKFGYINTQEVMMLMPEISTIEKQIGFLKWFLRWAKSKGYNNNFAYETFKPKLKSTQKKIK